MRGKPKEGFGMETQKGSRFVPGEAEILDLIRIGSRPGTVPGHNNGAGRFLLRGNGRLGRSPRVQARQYELKIANVNLPVAVNVRFACGNNARKDARNQGLRIEYID
jgi:hypothetical protein